MWYSFYIIVIAAAMGFVYYIYKPVSCAVKDKFSDL
jgi:hypothetical protein